MSNLGNNRVLSRIQARDLTKEEMEVVYGGIQTTTICTIGGPSVRDGDPGEC